jgi:glyceraldehyde 3-phosphate dehydrogenase
VVWIKIVNYLLITAYFKKNMIRIAINGFGRIGRQAFKAALSHRRVKVVAVNDLADNKTLAHLFKYDTVYGTFPGSVGWDQDHIIFDGKKVKALSEREPANLPWKKLKVDVVLECTGIFRSGPSCQEHLTAGAKKVILSAPAKDDQFSTCVLGVNASAKHKKEKFIDNASCTTNCISPVMAVLQEKFGVDKALMTTIHGYTSDQSLQDGPHKDLRRARAAAENIIPTTTGAAKATAIAVPALKNKFDGVSMRVPVPVVSLADISAVLKKKVTVAQVNRALITASKTKRFKGILDTTNKPLVSSDFIGNTHSSVVDLGLTNVVGGNLVKVVAWYDNEVGYAHRLVEMAEKLG